MAAILSVITIVISRQCSAGPLTIAMTTITVRHKPIDLLRLGLHHTPRSAALKWMLLLVAVVMLGIKLREHQSHLGSFTLFAIVLETVIVTGGAFVFVLALNLLSALVRNRSGSPAAEVHAYSVTDTGLSRQSATSETLIKWGGARSLYKNKRAIYVGVPATSYFILPRHSFADDHAYQSFWNSIQKLAPKK